MRGCYAPNQTLLFSDGNAPILEAIETKKTNLMTLSSTATMEDLSFTVNKVAAYTVDLQKQWQDIYHIRTESGGELKVTAEHPLVSATGVMKQAQGLRIGDQLVREDGSFDAIVSIEIKQAFVKVYNVKPESKDYLENIVVAQGFLNGSVRYQNEYSDMINRRILRRNIPKEALPQAGSTGKR